MSEFDAVMLLVLVGAVGMGIWVFNTTKEKEFYYWAIAFSIIPLLYFLL